MKKLLEISSEEKNRILEMHQNATRKNYLTEAAQFNPSTHLIFCHKDGNVYNIKGGTGDYAIEAAEPNYQTYATIETGTYSPGEIASASFYLRSYDLSTNLQGGGVGIISSFKFTPNSNWTKKYGAPTVTLDFSQQIKGYKDLKNQEVGSFNGRKMFNSSPATQFVLKFTTPQVNKIVKSSEPNKVQEVIGVATIMTNDKKFPEKKITLLVNNNTQFGVGAGAPSSAPTTASPRT